MWGSVNGWATWGVAAATIAGWVTPAAAIPIRYNCDTAAGAVSTIDLAQTGLAHRITGRFSALNFRKHSEWFPVANVRLLSADRKNAVGLRIQRKTPNAPIELVLQTYIGGKEEQHTTLGALGVGDSARFVIEVTAGKARVQAGGRSIEVNTLIDTSAVVHVSCSSGEFLFEDLDWDAPPAR